MQFMTWPERRFRADNAERTLHRCSPLEALLKHYNDGLEALQGTSLELSSCQALFHQACSCLGAASSAAAQQAALARPQKNCPQHKPKALEAHGCWLDLSALLAATYAMQAC